MNANTVFMILGSLSIAANLCDWIAADGTRFMTAPFPKWPRALLAFSAAMLGICAVLHLAGVISAIYPIATLSLFVSGVQIYSALVRRWKATRL